MPSYEHNKLIERISQIDKLPEDPAEYETWIKAGAHLSLLQNNAEEDELIIYACSNYTFIHAVVVSQNSLCPLDQDDLLDWNGNPFSLCASYAWGSGRDDVWIERGGFSHGTKTLESARQLIFARKFEGLHSKTRVHYEVLQEYTHVTGIHWNPEQNAYCRFDRRGELEHTVSITSKTIPDVSLVSFKREPLEEYLAASHSILVQMFDFALRKRGDFTGWPDGPEDVIKKNHIFFRQKIDLGKAAYTRGVQILQPRRSNGEIFLSIKGEPTGRDESQYVEFIAYDWRNECVRNISTNPSDTTNYFQANDNSLPFETSPAFFNAEVLSKYKSDHDKYSIDERSIYCRDAWELRDYDVNEAGQVHVYICDLRNLPYSEQLYWKSFNEKPKTGISERAYINDFEGEWAETTDPLTMIKHLLAQWEQSDVPWWKLRDPASPGRVTPPLTSSRDEWARSFTDLAQFIIEGFKIKAIRKKLDELGIDWRRDEKSLSLLESVLSGETTNGYAQKLNGLRSVQRIRSKVGAHSRGTEADALAIRAVQEHGSYAAHFEAVCRNIASELEHIERAFSQDIAEDQDKSAPTKSSSAQNDESTK